MNTDIKLDFIFICVGSKGVHALHKVAERSDIVLISATVNRLINVHTFILQRLDMISPNLKYRLHSDRIVLVTINKETVTSLHKYLRSFEGTPRYGDYEWVLYTKPFTVNNIKINPAKIKKYYNYKHYFIGAGVVLGVGALTTAAGVSIYNKYSKKSKKNQKNTSKNQRFSDKFSSDVEDVHYNTTLANTLRLLDTAIQNEKTPAKTNDQIILQNSDDPIITAGNDTYSDHYA
jgi:hypothetical protein